MPRNRGPASRGIRNLTLQGRPVAEIKLNGSTTTATYLHADLLGSPRKATNASKGTVWQEHYDPYGKKLNGASDRLGYTGHAHDAETGYTYMQARFYDARVGRFLSTDPIHFVDDNPFTFNRYSYVNNNPYRYVDPTGMCTGSRITNDDGSCVSTGGSTTGTDGALEGMQKERAAQPVSTQVSAPHAAAAGTAAAAGAAETVGGSGLLSWIVSALSRVSPYIAILSLSGDTPQTDMYRHYGFADQAPSFTNGLWPGSFATTAQGPPMTGLQAQQLLALPHADAPNAYYNVVVPRSVPVIGPTLALPKFGQPGGGVEYIFPEGTPPGSVYGPFPIPPQ